MPVRGVPEPGVPAVAADAPAPLGGAAAPEQPTDESLALRLQAGESKAGEQLVLRYYPALIRYLHRLGGSEHLAEELHQQTWLSVLDHIGRFNPSSTAGGFKAWLFRIATNKANDHWRARGREKAATAELKLAGGENGGDALPAVGERLENTEEHHKLHRAIEQLPEAQRQVLLLRYYSNLKFVEIAEMLGCPLNTALGRMHKATLKLRQLMQQ